MKPGIGCWNERRIQNRSTDVLFMVNSDFRLSDKFNWRDDSYPLAVQFARERSFAIPIQVYNARLGVLEESPATPKRAVKRFAKRLATGKTKGSISRPRSL